MEEFGGVPSRYHVKHKLKRWLFTQSNYKLVQYILTACIVLNHTRLFVDGFFKPYCYGLVEIAMSSNAYCVSGLDHGCTDRNVLVMGLDKILYDVNITGHGKDDVTISVNDGTTRSLVKRYIDIEVEYNDMYGEYHSEHMTRSNAYCVQHHYLKWTSTTG